MQLTFQTLLGAAALTSVVQGSPFPQSNVQNPGASAGYVVNHHRANAVKDAFVFAWDGYYKYAFPNDQLDPQTNTFSNPRYDDETLSYPMC